MAKRGPKFKPIDKKSFENLCALQCTLVEISGFFNVCEDTIESWCKREYKMKFSEIYKIKSTPGRISLRRNMFKMSEHSVPMAIWLSKQHLGMKDVIETENINRNDNKLELVWEGVTNEDKS